MKTFYESLITFWPLLALPLIWNLLAWNVALMHIKSKLLQIYTLRWAGVTTLILLPLPTVLKQCFLIGFSILFVSSFFSKEIHIPGYTSYKRFLALLPPDFVMRKKTKTLEASDLWVPETAPQNFESQPVQSQDLWIPDKESQHIRLYELMATRVNPWITVFLEILMIATAVLISLLTT